MKLLLFWLGSRASRLRPDLPGNGVLSSAAINGKLDLMQGLKENVITGQPISAGTGLRELENMIIGGKEEYELLMTTKEAMSFDDED